MVTSPMEEVKSKSGERMQGYHNSVGFTTNHFSPEAPRFLKWDLHDWKEQRERKASR